jgi:hypothetical protein
LVHFISGFYTPRLFSTTTTVARKKLSGVPLHTRMLGITSFNAYADFVVGTNSV